MKKINVVAAVIEYEEHFLCVQRPSGKYAYTSQKYEFPGGKIEEGESDEEALKREIREELSMNILVKDKVMTVEHKYPDFFLTMHAYACTVKSRNFVLHEHIASVWLVKDDLNQLDWAAADIPIVNKLMLK
jgi:8-oxo-dGTP diphosphatase